MDRRWHEQVQQPLIEQAMRVEDANARLRQLMVAELSQTFHAHVTRVNSELARSSDGNPQDQKSAELGNQIRQLLAVSKQLIALLPEASA